MARRALEPQALRDFVIVHYMHLVPAYTVTSAQMRQVWSLAACACLRLLTRECHIPVSTRRTTDFFRAVSDPLSLLSLLVCAEQCMHTPMNSTCKSFLNPSGPDSPAVTRLIKKTEPNFLLSP
ncbi:hypothetical protein Mapa_010954 [Marchantia paleacea]|nr:hypothetical protein Mapa_010954 [Marchantia paleacea]